MPIKAIENAIPVAPLRVINMNKNASLGAKADAQLVKRRKETLAKQPNKLTTIGYERDSYLVDFSLIRNNAGEGKVIINESIRGTDLFIIADVMNFGDTYEFHGSMVPKTPDEHYQDLKRVIMACSGHPKRITVIMPFLYEGRQNFRYINESLDCALMLQELTDMGVDSIITFDAHDARVQNAIPLEGFDNFYTSYQFIHALLSKENSLEITNENLMIISPDEGGMRRAVYYSTLLGVNMGMFFKRRDYTKGSPLGDDAPVLSIEFLGNDFSGKEVILVDDMISSGDSILEVSKELKKRGAAHVYICATFGLFSDGLERFDTAYKEKLFDRIYTTNLTYCSNELLSRPYYVNVDVSDYVSLIIDTVNHDVSVSGIMDATSRIQELLSKHNHTN